MAAEKDDDKEKDKKDDPVDDSADVDKEDDEKNDRNGNTADADISASPASDDDGDDEKPEDDSGKDNETDDSENSADDSADYEDSSNSNEKPEEVATQSTLLYKALSSSNEDYSDETRITNVGKEPMNSDWEELMDDFINKKTLGTFGQKYNELTYGPGNESMTLSSFGFLDLSKNIQEEFKLVSKGIVDKLPVNVSTIFNNCFKLTDVSIGKVNDLLVTYNNREARGSGVVSSYLWGGYSRQFMCGNRSLTDMNVLISAANQQMLTHNHIGTDGFNHLLECTEAIFIFLKNVKDDSVWATCFNKLKASLVLADKRLQVSQDQLLNKTNPDLFPPRAPNALRSRKIEANGKALVSLIDSVYYCRSHPVCEVTNLNQLVLYGTSLEQDTVADKNNESGIHSITNSQMIKLLNISKNTLSIIKKYELKLVTLINNLVKIKIQFNEACKYTSYSLSKERQQELYFIGVYLMEIVTNPHVANVWQAMRLVHTTMSISNQILPNENNIDFKGFTMNNTRLLMKALENLTELPDTAGPIPDAFDRENTDKRSPENALNGMDVHPKDQAIIDDSVDTVEQSAQLGNSVNALEGLRDNCTQMINYGTPVEQRRAITTINASHMAICVGLGLRTPVSVGLESNGGESVALEGLFTRIGETIKNIIQSVKNMWNNWMEKIKTARLRSKAQSGDVRARLELINRKKHLLIEADGEVYNNRAVITNIGMYGKIDTPIKALASAHALHEDFSKYSVITMHFADTFYSNLDRNSPDQVRQSIAEDIMAFKDTVFIEKKNPHAIKPHKTQDQTVSYIRQIPGNSALSLVMPGEIYNEKYSSDRINEVRVMDLSAGMHKDAVTEIKAATVEDLSELMAAYERYATLVEENCTNWARLENGYDRSEELSEYVYQEINGRDKESADAARMYYNYLSYFIPQVMLAFDTRITLSYTIFSAVMTWIEESIIKAEEIIKSQPAVSN